jgi:hypothetical protein
MRSTASLILIFGCAVTASAREEYKRDFRQSVALPSGRSFRIESQFGRISIHAQPKNEVAIQAVIRCSADTAAEARRCVDQIQIAVEGNGSGVSVRTDYPRDTGRRDLSYAVDYDIAMPDTAPLDLRNRYGSADVSDLHSSATIASSYGSVSFLNGRGPQHIENTFGMVEVRKNEGDVTINNSGSPTIAADVTGAIEITNRYGEVRVTNAGRSVGIHSENSNVQVSNVAGPITVEARNGVVMVDAKTVRSCQPVSVRDSFGLIRFTVPQGAGYNVTARTTFGYIHTDPAVKFSASGDAGQDAITGKIAGGGCDLRLINQNGNIDILR